MSAAAPNPPAAVPAKPRKQAVVLVHGMGEQTPMQTLRGFVETMWVGDRDILARRPADPDPPDNPVWWKPDPRTGSFELARITTRGRMKQAGGPEGVRTDFFEFYWADLTDANTVDQLRDWYLSLMLRRPSQVPADVRPAWWLLWGLTGAALAVALAYVCDKAGWWEAPAGFGFLVSALLFVYGVILAVLLKTFGDVARYVRAKPPNIAARREIRERGLALLRQLSDCGEYGRLVVVGHSLGSIIAYDLLKLFWAEREAARTMADGDDLHRAWTDLAAKAGAVSDPVGRTAFRRAQSVLFTAMLARRPAPGAPWLISDFITVGSPLAHADFLLARDAAAFRQGMLERRFPSCPPQREDPVDPTLLYPMPQDRWRAHHAAVFGPVRWTNLCDPARAIVVGDFVSGLAAPLFGAGVEDRVVAVRSNMPFSARLLTHTSYWTRATCGPSPQLAALREALRLDDA